MACERVSERPRYNPDMRGWYLPEGPANARDVVEIPAVGHVSAQLRGSLRTQATAMARGVPIGEGRPNAPQSSNSMDGDRKHCPIPMVGGSSHWAACERSCCCAILAGSYGSSIAGRAQRVQIRTDALRAMSRHRQGRRKPARNRAAVPYVTSQISRCRPAKASGPGHPSCDAAVSSRAEPDRRFDGVSQDARALMSPAVV
jgi:hypothetical protein